MKKDVALVVPPVLTVVRPLIGPSILAAQLKQRGISCSVHYSNIEYAEEIGVEQNEWLSNFSSTNWLLSEWIFSHAAFPAHHNGDPEKYFLTVFGEDYPAEMFDRVCQLAHGTSSFASRQAKKILDSGPQVVGFSTSFEQTAASLAIAEEVKKLAPETVIVFGGSNCMGEMARGLTSAFDVIDYAFNGESDVAFPNLCQEILDGERPTEAVVRPKKIMCLDDLPIPEYSDYFDAIAQTEFRDDVELALALESSRGCWWGQKNHCTFCGLNAAGMTFRSKSAPRLISEIEELSSKWQVNNFATTDNIMDFAHIDTVFRKLKRGDRRFRFFYEIKSNLKDEQIEILAQAGVDTIQPGIESLSDNTLKIMKKGVTALQNIFLLKRCKELNIHPIWNILAGFPGETVSSYRETIELIPKIAHLHPPRNVAQLRLDRFSPNYEQSELIGFSDVRPLPAYKFVFPLSEKEIRDIAYFFEGTCKGAIDDNIKRELQTLATSWQDRHFRGGGAPLLSAVTIAGAVMVKDTRVATSESLDTYMGVEAMLIHAFRNVKPTASVLHEVAEEVGSEVDAVEESLAKLVKRGLVVTIGRASLTLVCFPSQHAVQQPKERLFPGGELKRSIGDAFACKGRSGAMG
ncbi:RiPP maturation radical SAM C-methyltransferase [Palleronia caenipelagi]|uniref:RiPP maturation radical SAM protein 1 n=1 Tax=Palleronia caenipelagi TaxID=2489174 RepID=A0A547PJG0_9RHOB|nr:RiPP maturation radical SAM C-methyltransferase [Palleronia caenipelagi]TRD14260.1 RiPP maturation radical SAM protein 1 [Palleronia caenipelagi]